jgi:hypothetical protein
VYEGGGVGVFAKRGEESRDGETGEVGLL